MESVIPKRIIALSILFVVFVFIVSLSAFFKKDTDWVSQTGDPIASSPFFYADNPLFLNDFERIKEDVSYAVQNDVLVAQNKKTGKELWRFSAATGYVFTTAPFIVSRRVYIADSTGKLYALNARTGGVLWIFSQSPLFFDKPAQMMRQDWFGSVSFSGNYLFVGGRDGVVHALQQKDG